MPEESPYRVLQVGTGDGFSAVPSGESEAPALDVVRVGTVGGALDRLSAKPFACVVLEADCADGGAVDVRESARDVAPGLPFVVLVRGDRTDLIPELIEDDATEYVLVDAEPEPAATVAKRVREIVVRSPREPPSERRGRTERVLAATPDPFRQAVEQAGHAVYITDTDGTIEYVNPAFEASTGYSRPAAIGSDPSILKSGEHSREFYAGLWNTILSGEVWKGEVINQRRDGQNYVAEQTVAPIEDRAGTIDGFVAINTDVTQRKAYQQRLQRYENIIGNLPVGVYRTTAEAGGEFVEVNSTLVSIYDAYSKSELLEESVASFYADSGDREAFRAELRENGHVTEFEVEQRTLSGEPIDVTLTAIRTEADGQVYIDGILTDVTDRRRRERELKRKNEQLEQFASIVTHDLRNPLNVAQSRLELVRGEYDSEHLDVVDEQLVRMEELIEDVLAIARHGEQVEDRKPVDVAPLVESCWETVETGDADLIVDTDRTLSVDTSRIQQLFENLFRNAIEHGGRDVTIRVGTLSDGFYVEDDGPGIPPAEREAVFEHGYTTDDDGTGFGLNIVEEIVTAHGWDVQVTDGTEGGARFEITGVERRDRA
ncbi:PAS domain S-box protein [Halorientalis pallida]|uniref:histidine kinase n=1 Tax=Halorientalis pallida TaxID=2479928 RepID=A0A498L0N4_9EURY|nr:PAS domain S-box protein [Halorientalis pallida]RXK49283.1 PAS domain S-box protein [Halorientalis pallida]